MSHGSQLADGAPERAVAPGEEARTDLRAKTLGGPIVPESVALDADAPVERRDPGTPAGDLLRKLFGPGLPAREDGGIEDFREERDGARPGLDRALLRTYFELDGFLGAASTFGAMVERLAQRKVPRFDAQIVEAALERRAGDVQKAAEDLGVSWYSLFRWAQAEGLSCRRPEPPARDRSPATEREPGPCPGCGREWGTGAEHAAGCQGSPSAPATTYVAVGCPQDGRAVRAYAGVAVRRMPAGPVKHIRNGPVPGSGSGTIRTVAAPTSRAGADVDAFLTPTRVAELYSVAGTLAHGSHHLVQSRGPAWCFKKGIRPERLWRLAHAEARLPLASRVRIRLRYGEPPSGVAWPLPERKKGLRDREDVRAELYPALGDLAAVAMWTPSVEIARLEIALEWMREAAIGEYELRLRVWTPALRLSWTRARRGNVDLAARAGELGVRVAYRVGAGDAFEADGKALHCEGAEIGYRVTRLRVGSAPAACPARARRVSIDGDELVPGHLSLAPRAEDIETLLSVARAELDGKIVHIADGKQRPRDRLTLIANADPFIDRARTLLGPRAHVVPASLGLLRCLHSGLDNEVYNEARDLLDADEEALDAAIRAQPPRLYPIDADPEEARASWEGRPISIEGKCRHSTL